jgi:isopentenyl phosphate kinase
MLKVVKLGGAVITFKESYKNLRRDVLSRLLREIAQYYSETGTRIVLVHGGGSFGHAAVSECLRRIGYIDLGCYVATADAMDQLSGFVRGIAMELGLPVVSIPPRALCTFSSGSAACSLDIFRKLISRGLIPITYGDVVYSDKGFEVLSGDTLAWLLTRELGAAELIFVTDVDGVYDRDPKLDPSARLIREAHARDVVGYLAESSFWADVTGGMRGKLLEGLRLGVRGVKVKVVGGLIEGNLYKALVSDSFRGSIIWY